MASYEIPDSVIEQKGVEFLSFDLQGYGVPEDIAKRVACIDFYGVYNGDAPFVVDGTVYTYRFIFDTNKVRYAPDNSTEIEGTFIGEGTAGKGDEVIFRLYTNNPLAPPGAPVAGTSTWGIESTEWWGGTDYYELQKINRDTLQRAVILQLDEVPAVGESKFWTGFVKCREM